MRHMNATLDTVWAVKKLNKTGAIVGHNTVVWMRGSEFTTIYSACIRNVYKISRILDRFIV